MSFHIEDFWIPRLSAVKRLAIEPSQPGWTVEASPNRWFVEADLHLREGYDDLDAAVWFVAAPGAVGKSTLAKEMSARTGAVYVDLASASKVGGNFVAGGILNNELYGPWSQDETTILIDALDEGRLGVTQRAFEDFLLDARHQAQQRSLPIVIFGRVGIVEEAWLIVSNGGRSSPIFDIDYFDTDRSESFVMAAMDRLTETPARKHEKGRLAQHRQVYQAAARTFVEALENVTADDGRRFAGYAPVLEAVASFLLAVPNPAGLDSAVHDAIHGDVLPQLSTAILNRESAKLRDRVIPSLSEVSSVTEELYGPDEQLARLSGVVYHTTPTFLPPRLPAVDVPVYEAAVNEFLTSHPFLDGLGRAPSGAVFAAVVNAHALLSQSGETLRAAEANAGAGPHTPNPFLADFYLPLASEKLGDDPVIQPEHVVVLYESVRARALVGQSVQLTLEADDTTDSDAAEVEIEVDAGGDGSARPICFRTSVAGELRFGRQVSEVTVNAPHLDVVIGSGNPVEIVAPGALNVGRIRFNCPELVVVPRDHTGQLDGLAFTIEASELAGSILDGPPLKRGGAELWVSWPGAKAYPWTSFAGTFDENDEGDEALRGLRRLVMAFRSHSKGRLARIEDKIEHRRITKGDVGVALRDRLMADGVLYREGPMYFLDPDTLGSVVGASYHDLRIKHYNEKVRVYLATIAP